jgi:hypothetical protein
MIEIRQDGRTAGYAEEGGKIKVTYQSHDWTYN